ncbi:MAG: SCO family protein [Acidobacteriota bacterium]
MSDSRSYRRALIGLFALMWVMLAVTGFLFLQWQDAREAAALEARAEALPVLLEAPDFSFTNRDGRTIDRQSLGGQPWVADFIFTTCPGVCPVLTRRMKDLADEVPADRVRLVSISVDPDNDTPDVLEAYAQKNGAGDNWLFLTGDRSEIERVIKDGFKLAYDPTPQANSAEAIVHSNRFVLVDAAGQIRGYYDAFNDDDLANLRRDLASLLAG